MLKPNIPFGDVIFLQAPLSEKIFNGSTEDLRTRYRIPKILEHFQVVGTAKFFTDFELEYTKRRLRHDDQAYMEGGACQLMLQIKTPKIVFDTIQLILNLISQSADKHDLGDFKFLIIEKYISENTFLRLVLMLPNFEKIFITGDKFQLPTYTGNLPREIVLYWHRAAIYRLAVNDQIT